MKARMPTKSEALVTIDAEDGAETPADCPGAQCLRESKGYRGDICRRQRGGKNSHGRKCEVLVSEDGWTKKRRRKLVLTIMPSR